MIPIFLHNVQKATSSFYPVSQNTIHCSCHIPKQHPLLLSCKKTVETLFVAHITKSPSHTRQAFHYCNISKYYPIPPNKIPSTQTAIVSPTNTYFVIGSNHFPIFFSRPICTCSLANPFGQTQKNIIAANNAPTGVK